MNYRINTKAVSLVVMLILVAVGLFVYTLVTAPTSDEVKNDVTQATSEENEIKLITAKHQYIDGVHTIVGKSELPTPCHRLVTEPFFLDSGTNEVEIRFNTLLEGEACPNEIFEVPFRVTFEGKEGISISATWNGSPARLNLVPVQQGETLEDELYIKG
jgi:hypothetical protein